MSKVIGLIMFIGVHIVLTLGVLGAILVEAVWMRAGYLIVAFAMADVLYQRKIRKIKRKRGNE